MSERARERADVTVAELWRYPVKSVGGERVETLDLEAGGVPVDRAWGLRDLGTGLVLTAKRCGQLLDARARVEGPGVVVELPDGTVGRAGEADLDAALSAWLDRPVAMESAQPGVRTDYDDGFAGRPGTFHDSSPLHLVTTATLDQDDPRRYRANVVVGADDEPFFEDAWVGSSLAVGPARLAVSRRCGRCVMVTRPQPGIGQDRTRLTRLRERDSCFGVYASVETPGTLGVGDLVQRT